MGASKQALSVCFIKDTVQLTTLLYYVFFKKLRTKWSCKFIFFNLQTLAFQKIGMTSSWMELLAARITLARRVCLTEGEVGSWSLWGALE